MPQAIQRAIRAMRACFDAQLFQNPIERPTCDVKHQPTVGLFGEKHIVALAALASISAFAQSSVAISGNVDLGYTSVKDSLSADGYAGKRVAKSPIGNGAAGWTSSSLGLDVTEDLGNGTKAGYSAAMDLNSISGTDAGGQLLGNARHSYVQLSGGAGQVRYGYMFTLDDQIQGGVGRNTPTGNTRGRFQNA